MTLRGPDFLLLLNLIMRRAGSTEVHAPWLPSFVCPQTWGERLCPGTLLVRLGKFSIEPDWVQVSG